MKSSLFLIALVIPMALFAGEAVVQGGRSPSGKYEVQLTGGAVCEVSIIDTKTKKVLRTSPLGYGRFEGLKEPLYTHAMWSADESLVAVRMIETKRTSVVEVTWVNDVTATDVPIPNYLQNILGRLNSVMLRGVQQKLIAWDGHNLKLRVDATSEENSEGSFDVNISVLVGKGAVPSSILQSIAKVHE